MPSFIALASALLAPVAVLSGLLPSNATLINTPAQEACHFLYSQMPNATHFPNQSFYITDNTNFWSQASALGPACDFAPSCAEDLGWAVKVLKHYSAPFAMRGGGHMPIAGFNNINSSGVLLSSSGFTHLNLEPNSKNVHVGPANHWADVYKGLEPYGLTVVGGRLGVVGVPGFVTGGGISFFSWQYGWASNNLVSYTCVLADGSVVKATPTNKFADLFWALRGGGNSYALVTDIEMKTYYKPAVTIGQASYGSGSNVSKAFIDAVHNFAVYGQTDDAKASIIPIVNAGSTSNGSLTYTAYRFYDGNNTAPAALKNFTAPSLPTLTDTFQPRSMHQWTLESDAAFTQTKGLRERFYIIPLYVDKQALQIATDTYFEMVFSALSSLELWFTGWSPIPVSERFLQASTHSNGHGVPDGDPMGAEPANYYWIEIALSYANVAEYEPIVTKLLQNVDAKIRTRLQAAGLEDKVSKFLYLNDVDEGQALWEGYPKANVRRLQRIRDKYDPEMVFTKQMPGGWKVADAKV
ncbi:hypothetical protein LTR85_006706 [Meristemomyces frigidus]|nr:hypothetical protein LTR85_006706 [Meristemomyces frigidus]